MREPGDAWDELNRFLASAPYFHFSLQTSREAGLIRRWSAFVRDELLTIHVHVSALSSEAAIVALVESPAWKDLINSRRLPAQKGSI